MKILFVCTHNRCRSILAEAICNHFVGSDIQAWSAGSSPSGVVHPLALSNLKQRGIETTGLKSQSWDEFADVQMDAVVTLCDSAAGESCPLWMGNSVKAHWGMPDPSSLSGSTEAIEAAFDNVISTLENRVQTLATLIKSGLEIREALGESASTHPAPTF